jgi:hypothetical protein
MRAPWLWLLAGATLLAWLPLLGVLLAIGFADLAGCQVNEAGGQPCVVGGTDWGPWLTTLFTLGWLMLVTIPLMLASIVAWVIVLVVWLRQRRDAS